MTNTNGITALMNYVRETGRMHCRRDDADDRPSAVGEDVDDDDGEDDEGGQRV